MTVHSTAVVKQPFSDISKWLSVAGLIFMPCAIVGLVLAAVAENNDEPGADSARSLALMMLTSSLMILIMVVFAL